MLQTIQSPFKCSQERLSKDSVSGISLESQVMAVVALSLITDEFYLNSWKQKGVTLALPKNTGKTSLSSFLDSQKNTYREENAA